MQARGLAPFECSGSLQRVSAQAGGLRSVMDVPLLRFVPGFLADMDAVLQQPRVSLSLLLDSASLRGCKSQEALLRIAMSPDFA